MADLYDRMKRFQKAGKISAQKENFQPEDSAQEDSAQEGTPQVIKPKSPKDLLSIPGVVRGTQLNTIIEQRDENKRKILSTIGVEVRENSKGSYGYRESHYSSHEMLFPASEIQGQDLARQTRDEIFHSISAEQILFLDTETTGLAGGTGTLPFLVGIGYFTETGFTVKQYLMRDYDEEPAVLDEITNELSRFPAISTYNGKRFDIPLLESRYLLNRKRINFSDFAHLDLLYPARRLWSLCLPDCSLSTVEKQILGKSRGEDVPGEQIPYIYFDFLRGIRVQRMRPVMLHNENDIFSLAMLAARTCQIFRDPFKEFTFGGELIGLARNDLAAGEIEKACQIFEFAITSGKLEDELCTITRKHLSLLYKRLSLWEKATELWKPMADDSNHFALLELAKYYEHKERNFSKALEMTEFILEMADNSPRSGDMPPLDELHHRKKRLLDKIQKS